MKLTTKGRYAVMAVVDLASMRSGRPVPLAEIAERQDISLSYLEQLFAKLKKGGVVKSVRGPGGGYMLASPSNSISIAEIVKSVEDDDRMVRCAPVAPGQCLESGQRCATHDLWEMLTIQMERVLATVSLADVCEGKVSVDRDSTGLPAFGDD